MDGGLINMNYVKLLGNTLSDIERYQRVRFKLPSSSSSIYMQVSYSSDDLYQLSKLREDKKTLQHKTLRRAAPKPGNMMRALSGKYFKLLFQGEEHFQTLILSRVCRIRILRTGIFSRRMELWFLVSFAVLDLLISLMVLRLCWRCYYCFWGGEE